MFLDVCKKWHWIPLAGPGARRNLVSVDRHGYDRRSQDLGEKKVRHCLLPLTGSQASWDILSLFH